MTGSDLTLGSRPIPIGKTVSRRLIAIEARHQSLGDLLRDFQGINFPLGHVAQRRARMRGQLAMEALLEPGALNVPLNFFTVLTPAGLDECILANEIAIPLQ